MISDKEILLSLVNRAITNFTSGTPLSLFADSISDYVCNVISPYIDIFTNSKGHFDSSVATAYLQKKAEDEIEQFKAQYYGKEKRDDEEKIQ